MHRPLCKVEIIIVVNARHGADNEAILNNNRCIRNIECWKNENTNCIYRLYVFNAGEPSVAGWGVGLARKTGMDETLRRFSAIDRPDGVIVCLDADCTVQKNYFVSIEKDLLNNRDNTACSIYFEHPLKGMICRRVFTGMSSCMNCTSATIYGIKIFRLSILFSHCGFCNGS